MSFFKEINKNYTNENLIVSPLSAYQVLSLTANGAKGKTLKEMISALGNKDLEELNKINIDILNLVKNFKTVEIANAIMSRFNPKKEFLSTSSKYGATVEPLKSVNQVNSWCSKKTHGKINKILDKLDKKTIILLLNAVYFKGMWSKKFYKYLTAKKPFYNLNDKSKEIKVDRMSITESFSYYENNELQIVELPYKQDSMSAVIILPNEKSNINEFISKFDDVILQNLFEKMSLHKVHLGLPKFELTFDSTLNEFLKKMGMIVPFVKFSADFTGLKDAKDDDIYVYIDEVIQKTFLKVDEEGTEAAAVTVVKGNYYTKSIKPKIKIYPMIVDRPFLFLLKNKNLPKNHELIFMSKIEVLK
jgi:serpin B